MGSIEILWVDDEIDNLKPHIFFLERKGHSVTRANNGRDAIELCRFNNYDVVFLDENMPGLSGLEVLVEIKALKPKLPIIMITKSEEEQIMEEAIGNKITDYLIKPVNPNQILSSLKKNLDHRRLISEKTTLNYQQEFRKITLDIASVNSFEEWEELYKKLIYWELELENISDSGLTEILESQKQEANILFFKFIKKNYKSWINKEVEAPTLSNQLFKDKVVPELDAKQPTLLLVIDNLRYDQFFTIEEAFSQQYKKISEHPYCSILPTATQYARNALFAGMLPLEISKELPQFWKNDTDEGGKNLFENELLNHQLKKLNLSIKSEYIKITTLNLGKQLVEKFNSFKKNDLTVVVYNFVDMLSHSKTEMEVIKELASDAKAYRSLTKSWFLNSPLFELIQKAQNSGFKLIVTTDHGTINVTKPTKIIGDRSISANLRYKTGRSLTYESNDVFEVKNPEEISLPSIHINNSFVFAKENLFFAYPNNYNHYVKYFKNTFQHGGISMEEMLIPFAVYLPK